MLWVIMPAYNEEACVAAVVTEWLPALRALDTAFTLLAIDDGSRDRTLDILKDVASVNAEVTVVDQPNRGHGQSCVVGYRRSLEHGADWVLQIDSDGQCDPRFVASLWAARRQHPVVFGRRRRRGDGRLRSAISATMRLTVWLATRTWVADANVPYRLIGRDALAAVLADVPADFHLANVLLAVRLQRRFGIHWVPIDFRPRAGGSAAVKLGGFVRAGARLYHQLRRA